jgi:hypothetical protein
MKRLVRQARSLVLLNLRYALHGCGWRRPEIGAICGGVIGFTLAHGLDEGPLLEHSEVLILKITPQPPGQLAVDPPELVVL